MVRVDDSGSGRFGNKVAVEATIVAPDAPDNPRHLVGESDGSLIRVSVLGSLQGPRLKAGQRLFSRAASLGNEKGRAGPMNQ